MEQILTNEAKEEFDMETKLKNLERKIDANQFVNAIAAVLQLVMNIIICWLLWDEISKLVHLLSVLGLGVAALIIIFNIYTCFNYISYIITNFKQKIRTPPDFKDD